MSSFKYNNVYIKDYESIVGPTEANGNLSYPNIIEDYYYNEDKIEDAERLKEKFMEVERENAVELEEDCYFLADLRECTVFDTEGKELGKIYDVIQTKNNDVYWIRKPKELLIPVLKSIVLDINIDERKITIRPVGEWMDED